MRYLLGQSGVGQILHLRQRHGLGGQCQGDDRRIGRVHLAVDRRIGQILGQEGARGVDRCLHLLLGHIQAQVQAELEGDDGAAAGAGRCHLPQPGHLSELPLQRSRDGGRGDIGAGAGVEGRDLDGRVINLRQGGDRQLMVGNQPRQQDGKHDQRGCNRTQDKDT